MGAASKVAHEQTTRVLYVELMSPLSALSSDFASDPRCLNLLEQNIGNCRQRLGNIGSITDYPGP